MKKLFLITLIISVFVSVVSAYDLHWEAPEKGVADSYNIYIGEAPESMMQVVSDVRETTYNIDDLNLQPGDYYFAVTAEDIVGCESGVSNIINHYTLPPSPPTNLRVVKKEQPEVIE